MPNWLVNNIGSIFVLLLLIGGLAAVSIHLVKQKKQGKSSCGCGCQNCAMKGCCHKEKK